MTHSAEHGAAGTATSTVPLAAGHLDAAAIGASIRKHLMQYMDRHEAKSYIPDEAAIEDAVRQGTGLVLAAEKTGRMEDIVLAADEPVHDCADAAEDGADEESEHATDVNNRGLAAQFAYLAAFNGAEQAVRLIRLAAADESIVVDL